MQERNGFLPPLLLLVFFVPIQLQIASKSTIMFVGISSSSTLLGVLE